MTGNTTQDTLAAFKAAQKSPIADPLMAEILAKSTFSESTSPTTGLTFYDLEQGAKLLYPVLTPLRNDIPRATGKGGIQANWKAITGINTSSVRAGISPGNRGGVIAVTTQDYNAVYKGIGLEANVDFEAVYAGQGFDDLRALAAQTLLESLMLQEEQIILGGNGSLALATTPTPALTASSSGGSLGTETLSVIAVALTLDGYLNASIAGGIPGTVSRTNADGSSDSFGGGSAQKSANATVSVTGSTGSVAATVSAVRGAGSNSGAGTSGTANTGGGGGGGNSTGNAGGNGGSGVVILSVPTANYSGTTTGSPTVTTSGSNTIMKFTVSGSYTA
jgi:hypothetical protein